MRDIEELVRTTLSDPRRELPGGSAQLAAYRERAAAVRRRRTVVSGAAVAATVAAIATGAVAVRQAPAPPSAAPGAPTDSQSVATATVDPAPRLISEVVPDVPNAVDAVLSQTARDCCYALAYVLDMAGKLHSVELGMPGARPALGRATPTEGWTPIKAVAAGLTVQDYGPTAEDIQAWSWAPADDGSTFLRQYDLGTLKVSRTVHVAAHVFDAVAVDGALWLAADTGLYRLPRGAKAPVALASRVTTFSLAVRRGDSATDVYAGEDPNVVRYDARSGKELARIDVRLGKTSLAIVDNALWVAGYAEFGAVAHTIVRLDPGSLAVQGGSPVENRIGPGAQIYPGSGIVWVDNYPTSSCIDAATGRELLTVAGRPPADSSGDVGVATEGGFFSKLTLPAACLRP